MVLPPTFVSGFHDETQIKKMKYNVFGRTGLVISHLSLGTGGFCLQYGDYSIQQCKETLHKAIKAGINFIDTAPWYGHGVSEEVLGKCLEGIPRRAYYIATKVGRYEADPKLMFNFSADKTRESIDTSLKRLGIDYIDLIQAHDIEFAKSLDIIIDETLPVLNESVKNGKAKYIGITGYPVSTLSKCLNNSKIPIDSVLSYSRLSLLNSTLNEYLSDFRLKNLGIVNAAGHCMGLLTNTGPQPWHPAPQSIKDICKEARVYCQSKGINLARLALYYCLQQPGPHTHLVGINTVELLDANLDILYNGITKEENEVLQYIQANFFGKLEKGDWELENENFKNTLL